MKKGILAGLLAAKIRLDALATRRGTTMDASYPKDQDPRNWRTINGSKVHLTKGKIDGGAGGKFTGRNWSGKMPHEYERLTHTAKFRIAQATLKSVKAASRIGKGKPEFYEHRQSRIKEKMNEMQARGEKLEQMTVRGPLPGIPVKAREPAIIDPELYKATRATSSKAKKVKLVKSDIDLQKESSSVNSETDAMQNARNKYIENAIYDRRETESAKKHDDSVRYFVKEYIEKSTPEQVREFYEKYPPSTLPPDGYKQAADAYNKRVKRYFKEYGLTEDEIDEFQDVIQRTMMNSSYCMRIGSKYIDNCIDDWFKNQFEVGKSGGLYAPETRRKAACNMFGCPKEIDRFERERYGYATQPNSFENVSSGGSAAWYGDANVQFKKYRLKGRVTYTLDDSLALALMDPPLVAGKIGEKTLAGVDRRTARYAKKVLEHAKEMGNKYTPDMLVEDLKGSYAELQYHGALTIADVESITFNSKRLPDKSTIERLKKAGINVYVARLSRRKVEPYDSAKR